MNKEKKVKEPKAPKTPKVQTAKDLHRSRRLRHGTMATVLSVCFVAAVVIINVIASILVERYPITVDLTTNKVFEISDESIEYIKGIDKDINVYVLATEEDFSGNNQYYNQANTVINKYALYSDRIHINYIDIYTDVDFAANYPNEKLTYGQILLDCEGRYQVLTAYDLFDVDEEYGSIKSSTTEQAMTGAIMNLTDSNPVNVVFLSGFGDNNRTDSTNLKSILTNNGYVVSEINFLSEDIPEEADAVVLCAPTSDLTTDLADKLSLWLENDGDFDHTMLYFADGSQPSLPVLESVLNEWGISVRSGYLAETDANHVYGNYTYLLTEYAENDFTEANTKPVLTPNAKALDTLWDNNSNRYTHILMNTYSSAVIVPEDAGEDWQLTDGEQGSYPIAVLGQRLAYQGTTAHNSYVAAFGSMDMTNSYFTSMSALDNGEYLVELMNTLTGKEAGITIVGKELGTESLGISAGQATVIGGFFQYFLPVIVILVGVIVWVRRRNK